MYLFFFSRNFYQICRCIIVKFKAKTKNDKKNGIITSDSPRETNRN